MVTSEEVNQAFADLGLRREDFQAAQHAPTREAAQEMLAALKARVKRRYRELALELHPDKTGGDETKTARFRLLAQVWADVDNLKIGAPRTVISPPAVTATNANGVVVGFGPFIRVVINGFRRVVHASDSTDSTSSTSSGPFWSPFR